MRTRKVIARKKKTLRRVVSSADKNGQNPECYTSFVADMNGFTPFDPRCPKIP